MSRTKYAPNQHCGAEMNDKEIAERISMNRKTVNLVAARAIRNLWLEKIRGRPMSFREFMRSLEVQR